MRPTVFLLVFFLLVTICKSQTYTPFPDSNAVWKVVWFTFPGQYYEEHFEYFTDGDTLLYDTLYTKIKKIEYNVFCSLDTISIEYAGAFRNDTANKKVYYIQVFPPIKKILYDFSLNVGDTVPHSFQNVLYPTLTVKDVDTVYINDEPRKRYKYWLGPNPLGFQFYVYEGIGADLGLFEEFAPDEFYYYLKCFHNNDTMEYIHPGDTTCNLVSDTCLINSLDDLPLKGNVSFDIYLSSDQVIIRHEYNINDLSLSVYNLRGDLIYWQKIDSDITYLTKDILQNGLYIFILQGANMVLDSKKVFINL